MQQHGDICIWPPVLWRYETEQEANIITLIKMK